MTPSAKQKVFAAHNQADFVLVTQSDQPLSLANAFRKPIDNSGEVMERSIEELIKHYEKLINAYDIDSKAMGLDLTETAKSDQIIWVSKISDIQF